MLYLIIILIIWLFDLPIHEDTPFYKTNILWNNLDKVYPNVTDRWTFLESFQYIHEQLYTHKIALYENDMVLFIYHSFVPEGITRTFFYKITIVMFVLHLWWLNIAFIVGSCLLPVFFYYFFVLADYYEVLEELLAYIHARI
jgi:hypothetical protein